MGTVCPKCGYKRQPTDMAPEGECPGCGVVYAKAEQAILKNKTNQQVMEVPSKASAKPDSTSRLTRELEEKKRREMETTRSMDMAYSAIGAMFLGFCCYFATWRFVGPIIFFRDGIDAHRESMGSYVSTDSMIYGSVLFGLIIWRPLYSYMRRKRNSWAN